MVKKICIDCKKECLGERCRKCHVKFSGNSFDFGTWHFDTETELYITTKYLLSTSPRNEEFKNEFFKELINKYHAGVIMNKLKVSKFKILTSDNQIGKWSYAKEKFRGGILVTGYFEPVGEWHGITLYPYKKKPKHIKSKLVRILREKWAEKAEIRKDDQLCEECKIMPYPQLHHDNISFKEIADKCMIFFTEEELKYGLGEDWWKQECISDNISDSHPAVVEMFKLHKDVKYKWLCYQCHKDTHSENKKQGGKNDS